MELPTSYFGQYKNSLEMIKRKGDIVNYRDTWGVGLIFAAKSRCL